MDTFSQRMGIETPRTVMQVGSMDDQLRNDLWNVVVVRFLSPFDSVEELDYHLGLPSDTGNLVREIWLNHFHWLVGDLPRDLPSARGAIQKGFLEAPWNRAYDFIEFVANRCRSGDRRRTQRARTEFIDAVNDVLTRNLSAYRFVGTRLAPIVSQHEVGAVEQAMGLKEPLAPVSAQHIIAALELLADRESPNYRNSVKESISAVEALCRVIARNPRATLGDALKAIERQGTVELHPALKEAFSKLYGYTNDAGGIRHALSDKDSVDAVDATFMLVTCSAFVNYLTQKATQADIQFEERSSAIDAPQAE